MCWKHYLLVTFFTAALTGCGDSKESSESKGWHLVKPAVGLANFVVIDKTQWENVGIYRAAIAEICGKKKFCVVLFWIDASLVPRKMPMTDLQSNGMVAGWNSNEGRLNWSCDNKNAVPGSCFSKIDMGKSARE